MQRNSVTHVLDRFVERFTVKYQTNINLIFKTDSEFISELTRKDYNSIWAMCRNDDVGYQLQLRDKSDTKAKCYKKIILYKNIPMWVVFTTRKKKPKTIYNVKFSQLKLIKT